jgi:hypothetical protein
MLNAAANVVILLQALYVQPGFHKVSRIGQAIMASPYDDRIVGLRCVVAPFSNDVLSSLLSVAADIGCPL